MVWIWRDVAVPGSRLGRAQLVKSCVHRRHDEKHEGSSYARMMAPAELELPSKRDVLAVMSLMERDFKQKTRWRDVAPRLAEEQRISGARHGAALLGQPG